MLAPFFLLFIIFTILPVFLSMLLGFTDFNMLEMPNIVWFDNYSRLFTNDEIFILACKNTLIFASITGPVSYRSGIPDLEDAVLLGCLRLGKRNLDGLRYY